VPDTKTNLQGSSKFIMNYINIGSNGFAQVGDEHYFAKNKVEMKYLLELIRDKFPIPEKLGSLCFFGVKSFPHDFGTYHEIVWKTIFRFRNLRFPCMTYSGTGLMKLNPSTWKQRKLLK
jgi:hypothetical protein